MTPCKTFDFQTKIQEARHSWGIIKDDIAHGLDPELHEEEMVKLTTLLGLLEHMIDAECSELIEEDDAHESEDIFTHWIREGAEKRLNHIQCLDDLKNIEPL